MIARYVDVVKVFHINSVKSDPENNFTDLLFIVCRRHAVGAELALPSSSHRQAAGSVLPPTGKLPAPFCLPMPPLAAKVGLLDCYVNLPESSRPLRRRRIGRHNGTGSLPA